EGGDGRMSTVRPASRQALDALREQEDSAFGGRVSAETLAKIADELYAIGQVLVAQPRLRRTLGDPATAPEARAGLLENLFGGKVGKPALELAKAAVAPRWSSPSDLADAPEGAGDDALFAAGLTEIYGRAISVRSALDPSVQGGLVVRVGDEVIDGSIATRFAAARAALAG